ncbi:MAG: hypothetical protein PHU71_07410, partial [Candidatus Gracilibacteria bacterium]|nr:hypothetical protein [Candidatus Gracilibacteria bacterium]
PAVIEGGLFLKVNNKNVDLLAISVGVSADPFILFYTGSERLEDILALENRKGFGFVESVEQVFYEISEIPFVKRVLEGFSDNLLGLFPVHCLTF